MLNLLLTTPTHITFLLCTKFSKTDHTELIEREGCGGGGVTPLVSLDRSLSSPWKWRVERVGLGPGIFRKEKGDKRRDGRRSQGCLRRATKMQIVDAFVNKGSREGGEWSRERETGEPRPSILKIPTLMEVATPYAKLSCLWFLRLSVWASPVQLILHIGSQDTPWPLHNACCHLFVCYSALAH